VTHNTLKKRLLRIMHHHGWLRYHDYDKYLNHRALKDLLRLFYDFRLEVNKVEY